MFIGNSGSGEGGVGGEFFGKWGWGGGGGGLFNIKCVSIFSVTFV